MHTKAEEIPQEEREAMEARILGFIFPNSPKTAEQREAFDRAVAFQVQHERSLEEAMGSLPPGMTRFSIGHFSMTFDRSPGGRLTRESLCDAAYGVLLRSGLLYRGVERVWGDESD